jgi:hypothetical protein
MNSVVALITTMQPTFAPPLTDLAGRYNGVDRGAGLRPHAGQTRDVLHPGRQPNFASRMAHDAQPPRLLRGSANRPG